MCALIYIIESVTADWLRFKIVALTVLTMVYGLLVVFGTFSEEDFIILNEL